jgi:YHS domain-containing protein
MEVDVDKGYGVMYQGQLYRFCHRSCLDKFEADPKVYLEADDTTARIQGDGL